MINRLKQPSRLKGIMAAVCGCVFLICAMFQGFQSLRTLGFHSVPGTVLSTKIDSIVTGRINLHTPVIEYAYTVNGSAYRNNVFDLVDAQRTQVQAEEIEGRYFAGTACTVYYDRSNPQTSTLSIGFNQQTRMLMMFFSLLELVHLIGGIMIIRQ